MMTAAAGILGVHATPASAATTAFVRTGGRSFTVNSTPFYVHGTNQYDLLYESQAMVDEVLQDASALGLNVLRTWAFCNGTGQHGFCLQPQPRIYDEASFRKLDYVISKAGQLGIRLVLPFVNNWQDFGGMDQYVAWCGSTAGHDDFYRNACTKALYKDYVQHVLTRVNTYTGVAYREDPTIMLWELANEPRCQSDPTGNTLLAWVDEMAAFIKSIDPNHLIGTGEEGWYTNKGTDWRHNGSQGADFLRDSQSSFIDAASVHLYPQANGLDEAGALSWIDEHVDDAHHLIGKPALLGEFGWQVPRQVFGDFSTGTETWSVDWGFSTTSPQRVASPSYNSNGAIAYTPASKLTANATAAGQRLFADPGVDLRGYQTIAGWVYLPATAPPDLRAALYTKSGAGWTWAQGLTVPLARGAWRQVSMQMSAVSQPEQVRAVGLEIFNGVSDYTGAVYVDGVNAFSTSTGATMGDRNRVYTDWYNRLDFQDIDGAMFWQLSGHRDDTTFVPDSDGYAVYDPEDDATSTIITTYSTVVARKNGTPPVSPALSVKSITLTLTKKGKNGIRKQAYATVAVVDQSGASVSGVTVSTHWSGAATDSDVTTTDSTGLAKDISSNEATLTTGYFKITVDSLVKSGSTYDPSRNVETSDQITF